MMAPPLNIAAQAALTQKVFKSLLHYDPETGVFTRLVRTSSQIHVGQVAGWIDRAGYRLLRVQSRIHRAHQLAWLYVHGEFPGSHLDHINGKRDDNRISNLRVATHSVNCENHRRAYSSNTLGVLGVSPKKSSFMSRIKVNGKTIYLGTFSTAEAAHEAYLRAKRQLHQGNTL